MKYLRRKNDYAPESKAFENSGDNFQMSAQRSSGAQRRKSKFRNCWLALIIAIAVIISFATGLTIRDVSAAKTAAVNAESESVSVNTTEGVTEAESETAMNEIGVNEETKSVNCLILGDSYSALGQWVNALEEMVGINEVVNLAVSGATLRDAKLDRQAYPYTSRPVSTIKTGNSNTAACQIEKLKRLMAGTDLDAGEKQIYQDESQYPDVIIIEFGKNDIVPDAGTSAYESQFWTTESNVYTKIANNTDATLGNYVKITDLENTDRTTFAGAVRYVYSSLHEIFPDSMFIFVTASGLFQESGERKNFIEVSEQIELACNYICQPVVRWDKVGRISYVDGQTVGDGTQSNPYITKNPSEYTLDSLHPNEEGGRLLAIPVANEIKSILPYLY